MRYNNMVSSTEGTPQHGDLRFDAYGGKQYAYDDISGWMEVVTTPSGEKINVHRVCGNTTPLISAGSELSDILVRHGFVLTRDDAHMGTLIYTSVEDGTLCYVRFVSDDTLHNMSLDDLDDIVDECVNTARDVIREHYILMTL